MRERLHQVGGQLDIVSTRSGTILTAVVPAPIAAHSEKAWPSGEREYSDPI